MDDEVQKSCWGIMAWTVVVLGGTFFLISLLGGFDAPTVLAAN